MTEDLDLQAANEVGEEKLPLTPDTIATFATQMLAMPWQESDDPDDPVVMWHLGGYEGSSAFGFLHVMVLGEEAEPAELAELTPPTIAAFTERWGQPERTEVASLPEFDPSNPTGPSMLRLMADHVGTTGLHWWPAGPDRLFILGVREEEAKPSRLVEFWVVPPGLLEQQESPEPAVSDRADRGTGSARTLQHLLDEEARTVLGRRTAAQWHEVMRTVDEAGRSRGGISWAAEPEHHGFEFRQWSDGAGSVAGWFFAPDGQVLLTVFDHESALNLLPEHRDDFQVQDRMYDGLAPELRQLLHNPPLSSDLTIDEHHMAAFMIWSSGIFVYDGETWSAAPGLAACMTKTPELFQTDRDGFLNNARGQLVGLAETGLPLVLDAIEAEYARLANDAGTAPATSLEGTSTPPPLDDFVISAAEQMVELPWPESADPDEHPAWKIEKLSGRTAYGIAHQLKFGWDVTRSEKTLSAERLAAIDARFGAHQALDLNALPEYDPTAEILDMRALLALILRDTGATRALRWQATGRRILLAGIEDDPGGLVAQLTRRTPAGAERLTGLVVVAPEMFEAPSESPNLTTMALPVIADFAMRYSWTDEEREAFRSPPYPLPAGLVPAIEALEAALPADHDERRRELIARADETYVPSSFFSGARRPMARTGLPAVVLELISDGVLFADMDEVEFLLTTVHDLDLPERDRDAVRHELLRRLVEVHLLGGDLSSALNAAERMSTVACVSGHLGWREVAAYFAATGSPTEFLDRWDRYDAHQDLSQLRRLQERLVRTVAIHEGWRAAIEVAEDRRFGAAFRRHAFYARAYGYDDLITLFSGEAAGVLDETGELHALVAAASAETPRPPTADHRGAEELLARISALDPESNGEAMRARDGLLFSLQGAVGEEETLSRLRAQLRTPQWGPEATQVVDAGADGPVRRTHIVMSNSESTGPLLDNLRPYPEQIRFALNQMNGDTFWEYRLWRAPADANLLETLPDSGGYLQCGGRAEAMTLQWRRLDADGVTHQYAVGKSDVPQDAPAVHFAARTGGSVGDVPADQVFTADEAARVVHHYFLTDTVPDGYRLSPISSCCRTHDHPSCEGRSSPPGRTLEFADRNLKIGVLQELMDQGRLPRFDWAEFAASQQIDLDESGVLGTAIPEALAYVDAVSITPELAEHVTSIEMKASNDIYVELSLDWNGEDDLFDVSTLTDLRHLPRLRSVELLYDLVDPDPALLDEIAAARDHGIDVRYADEWSGRVPDDPSGRRPRSVRDRRPETPDSTRAGATPKTAEQPSEMTVAAAAPGGWFLLSQGVDLFLDARYSIGAAFDGSLLFRLSPAEKAAYTLDGDAYLSRLAMRIHDESLWRHGRPFYNRDLYRGEKRKHYRQQASGAIAAWRDDASPGS